MTPMSGLGWNHRVQVSGGPSLPPGQQLTWVNAVAPGWFATYGRRLLAGRDISPADGAGSVPVAVVNEAFVRKIGGGQNSIGRHVKGVGLGVIGRFARVSYRR